MMEEIKPKKERKFLKAIGNIAKVLANELVMGIARKFIGKAIDKVGNKRQGLVITFVILASTFAIAQFPNTGNKQRLGFQTTADGLVWRGALSDTASIQPINNQNAWVILDTINLKFYTFDFTSNAWNLVGGASGLTMPFDSITFNTAKNGTVGVGEVEYNDTQGSLIQGLKGGNVTNVIGQQLHQRVNNRTGATLNKGDVVYLAGSQGNRITVAKGLAVTDAFSANTFGVVAEAIANNASGFIITEGLITGLNTSALTEDSAVYLSPTVAGALTSTKPQAPQHSVYIGVCVKSNNGSGELFVKIRNGQELDELHDTRISNPVTGATLYYSGGLWRDTTAALLVSDTASMLANYAKKSYVDTAGRFYAREDFSNVQSSTLTWTQTDTLVPGGVKVVQVYRNGQILLPSQYTIPTKTSVVIAATSYKIGENYTVIFPKGGGGAGSGGGSGSLTSISAGTGITVSPNPITTTGTVSADLSVLMELTDTSLLNLTSRFASKLNTTDTASLSNRINAKGNGTVTSVGNGYGLLSTQSPITTSGVIRVDSNTVYNYVRDSIVKVRIGNDTIKILKQEYYNVTTDTLTWTTTNKFPIQLRAFILLFRNGQLLINDQFSIIDTNKVKVAASSFKLGENYTLVTVSGIGSAGVSQTGNPVYPEAGIALSTGTTWASSIPNNSSNWNTAFTDRLKWDGGSTGLVAATGRTSLGGTTIGQSMFTLTNPSAITFPRFNADNTVSALTATNFRNDIGAGTVTSVTVAAGTPLSISNTISTPQISMSAATGSANGYLSSGDWSTFNGKQNALGYTPANNTVLINTTAPLSGGGNLTTDRTLSIPAATTSANGYLTSTDWNTFNSKQSALTNPVTGTGVTSFLPRFTGTSTLDSTRLYYLNGRFGVNMDASEAATHLTSRFVVRDFGHNFKFDGSAAGSGYTTTFSHDDTGLKIGNSSNIRDIRFTLNGTSGLTIANNSNNPARAVGIANDSPTHQLDVTGTFRATGAATLGSTLGVTGATTLSNLAGSGDRMVIASSTGLLSTQTIPSGGGGGSGTVTSVSGTGTVNGITLTGTVTTSGSLTLGGALSGVNLTSQVTGVLPIANGGTGGGNANDARVSLGATDIGNSLFTLSNSVSDKFIKVNTNNTITLLNASDTRTALGATTRGSNLFILPDNGAISFLRLNADNTVSQRAADGMRSDLGGTTIGQSMFTLTNPSAIRFPRFNADNTVSALSDVDFRTAIGAGTGNGNGTVTSVSGTAPISIANPTTTPAISIANASATTTGVVTSTTQTFGGAKTFNGDINAASALNVTGLSALNGGASIGTYAATSGMNSIIGVNSSNTIGKITVGSGLSLSSGVLSVNGTGTFTTTNSNYTITSTDTYIAFNNNFSNITVTLPSASTNLGRALYFRNVAAGLIISASNNVINNTVTTGTPDSSILGAGNVNYKWCTLVSDGTYWIKMQAN